MNSTYLQNLRKLSIVEGLSTLILFGIAMPLKYGAGMPLAVTICGSIHGVLFVALVAMLAGAVQRVPLPHTLALLGMFAAIVPFGPFVYDRNLQRLSGDATAKAGVTECDASDPA